MVSAYHLIFVMETFFRLKSCILLFELAIANVTTLIRIIVYNTENITYSQKIYENFDFNVCYVYSFYVSFKINFNQNISFLHKVITKLI